jgi:hypothetical protein
MIFQLGLFIIGLLLTETIVNYYIEFGGCCIFYARLRKITQFTQNYARLRNLRKITQKIWPNLILGFWKKDASCLIRPRKIYFLRNFA